MSDSLEQEIRTLRSLFWSERDPEGRAFAPLADAYVRAGETKEALDLLTDGTSRHPDFATGHVVAARLYLGQGMYSEAEISARRVLELDGENVVALESLAQILDATGQAESAGPIKATLAELDPEGSKQHVDAAGADLLDFHEPAPEADGGGFEDLTAGPAAAAASLSPALDDLPAMDLDALAPEPVWNLDAPAPDPEAAPEMSLDALAPEPEWSLDALAPDPEPEMSLDALAPDPELAPEMSLDALAPDLDPAPEMSLDALAPDLDPAPEMSLDALAPDLDPAPEMSLDALAPDLDPAPEMSLDALAPDLDPAPEMSFDALAPDPEPAPEMSFDALAPDPEPAPEMSFDALAPDPEPEMSLDALAPDSEPEMSLDALAPDSEPEMSLDALAPDSEPEMSLDALAPDPEPEMSLDALAPDLPEDGSGNVMPLVSGGSATSGSDGAAAPVWTRTLAELYVKQGFTDKALEVLRHLHDRNPDSDDIATRIAELERGELRRGGGDVIAQPPPLPHVEAGDEVEASARDLAEGGPGEHEVDTPFAWTEAESAEADSPAADGPRIGDYFDELLGWERRDPS